MTKLSIQGRRRLAVFSTLGFLTLGLPPLALSDATVGCNVGTGTASTECGVNSASGGSKSVAVGNAASASASDATALGETAVASGIGSTAVGHDAVASATRAHAIGRNTDATATTALAVGANAQATGLHAVALGGGAGTTTSARASSANSIAIGGGASGQSGAAASADSSVAIGNGTTAGFTNSVAIGKDAATAKADQIVLGDTSRFNLETGGLGLGTTTPEAPLDIVANPTTIGVGNVVFKIANPAGGTAIQLDPDDDGASWTIDSIAGSNEFQFSRSGTGSAEMTLDSTGNMVLKGTLITAGPTCSSGCDAVFDDDYQLASIEDHADLMWTNGYLPAVGPTTPNAPFNLSEQYGLVLNELETAHIYIDQLNAKLADQEARLARIEALIGD